MRISRPTSYAQCLVAVATGTALLSLHTSAQPSTPSNRNGRIVVDTSRVPLDPRNAANITLGGFRFMGGLQLTSKSERLHGLSDLDVNDRGRLTAVSDMGGLFEATIVLDSEGRLTGLADTTLVPLGGENGEPLVRKSTADAEGLAFLPNGDRLVSFEGTSRILLYPAAGGVPRRVPMPSIKFPSNGGMEALSADPDQGEDAYLVGHELTGDTWSCRVSMPECVKGPTAPKVAFFGLVALRRLPAGQTAYLLRTVDRELRNRIILWIVQGLTEVAKLDLAPPLNTDNFEGLAAMRRGEAIRFYMVSDDNAAPHQRTLLFAFDWQPR